MALALLGAALAGPRINTAYAGDLPALDPALAPFALQEHERVELKASWSDGTAPPYTFFLELQGTDEVDGVTHAKRVWSLPGKRKRTALIEWLRPEGASLLCSRRQVGKREFTFNPPLPVLVAPLDVGATWTWKGAIGELPAEIRFEVLPAERANAQAGEEPDGPEAARVRIKQVTRLEGPQGTLESRAERTYEAGLGLVGERGTFPLENYPDTVRGYRAGAPR